MVTRIGALEAPLQRTALLTDEKGRATRGLSFGELLEQAFEAANRAQWEVEQAAQKLATGEIEELHQVTILAEKANLSLQLMIALRNKVIEAYQEISRMQI